MASKHKRKPSKANGLNLDFKIEGISLGGGAPDLKLVFLPNGVSIPFEDKVTVNVVKLDLDVNNDGDIDDAEDKAINYLPGYSGDTRVLSTGTSFNAPSYVGPCLTSAT